MSHEPGGQAVTSQYLTVTNGNDKDNNKECRALTTATSHSGSTRIWVCCTYATDCVATGHLLPHPPAAMVTVMIGSDGALMEHLLHVVSIALLDPPPALPV